jgi:hypothetical protein
MVPFLFQVMQECWHQNPTVRLTALRVKKSLSRLECEMAHSLSHKSLY